MVNQPSQSENRLNPSQPNIESIVRIRDKLAIYTSLSTCYKLYNSSSITSKKMLKAYPLNTFKMKGTS